MSSVGKKIFLVGLATFMAGFFIGRKFSSNPPTQERIGDAAILCPQVHPLQCPPETNSAEVMAQAEKLYGNAFNMFLASLGISLTQKQQSALNNLVAAPESFEVDEALKEGTAPSTQKEAAPEIMTKTSDLTFAPTAEVAAVLRKEKVDISNLDDASLFDRAKRKLLKDPSLFFARSTLDVPRPIFRRLNGQYRGELFYIIGNLKGTFDTLNLTIDFTQKTTGEENEIEGNFSLVFRRDGVVNSESTGEGSNGNIRVNGEEIIIKAGPDRYLHMTSHRMREANYYQDGQFVGIARFNKL